MVRFRPNPLPALCYVALGVCVTLLTGMSPASGGLTPEQVEILQYMSLVKLPDGQGGLAMTVRLSGANLQIVNGEGSTATTDATGNLIVGYAEAPLGGFRTGSHNLVVGDGHGYTSSGGVVFGQNNFIEGPYATVTGGTFNTAREELSSVGGGTFNITEGFAATVNGGTGNRASGFIAAVCGGLDNKAEGSTCTVAGGEGNRATGSTSSILGGAGNQTLGALSAIAGGANNETGGTTSSVSGGCGTINAVDCTVLP